MLRYNRLLVAAPLPTKMATAGILAGLGDILSQSLSGIPNKQHDWNRMGRMVLWFSVGSAVPLHLWYNAADRVVTATGVRGLAQKMAIEEFLVVPPLHAGFFLSDAKLQGRSNSDALASVRENFWDAFLSGLAFWPLVQVVTYTKMPVRYRLLWVNVCQVGWSAWVSFLAARPSPSTPGPPADVDDVDADGGTCPRTSRARE